jgi:butyrate kinase
MKERILVINAGSTSLKLALYRGEAEEAAREVPFVRRDREEDLAAVSAAAREFLSAAGATLESLDAIAARGGLLRPLAGGTYLVDEAMEADLDAARWGEHASNLSAVAARRMAGAAGIPAYVVDPVTVDEMDEEARLTGIPAIRRRSVFHALSQKAAARRACRDMGRPYAAARLVVAHLGGGISVGAHAGGRVIDVNNALDGDGPIAPERAGTIPAGALADLCFGGGHSRAEVGRLLAGGGGMAAHLGTRDMREAGRRMLAGDAAAGLAARAMAYTVAKQIGAMAAALGGRVDAVVLTGAMAGWTWLAEQIKARVGFLAPVMVLAGNMEMEALALGALRVLRGEEQPLRY